MARFRCLALGVAVVLAASLPPLIALAQPQPPPAAEVTPDPWPRTFNLGGAKYTLYQPQLKSWDGRNLQAFAAVSVLPSGAKEPVFGALDITATTEVAKVSRTVHLSNVTIGKAVFPSALASAAQYQQVFQTFVSKGRSTKSLDRLDAMLAIAGEEQKARAVPVKNDPPRLIISSTAAVLVPIDGARFGGPWRARSSSASSIRAPSSCSTTPRAGSTSTSSTASSRRPRSPGPGPWRPWSRRLFPRSLRPCRGTTWWT